MVGDVFLWLIHAVCVCWYVSVQYMYKLSLASFGGFGESVGLGGGDCLNALHVAPPPPHMCVCVCV